MSSVKKHLKELENLKPVEELSIEKKLEFVEKQIEAFQTQAWRFQIEVDVAKRYIAVGEAIGGEEAYTATGEKNIVEAAQNLRSIVINIERLCLLRDELKKQLA
jgi:hypothetical protein